MSKTSNHAKAPKCAEFVSLMRDVFGEENVIVERVRENGVNLGEEDKNVYASVLQ